MTIRFPHIALYSDKLRTGYSDKLRTGYSDKQIVSGIQSGDESMARYLYDQCQKYFDRNYKSVFTMDAFLKDDIFQETYIKLWTDIERHRIHIGDDGELWRIDKKGEERRMTARLVTFQMDIAKNVFRVWQRSQKEELIEDVYSCAEDLDNENQNGFEQALDSEDQREMMQEIVQEAIMNLSETCREILTMFYYEDMSLDEILAHRGENTSKNGLKTGKHKCLKHFESDVRSRFMKFRIKY